MSGRCRSSVDATFMQQNIGKFVNINKQNQDRGVEKGETRPGTNSLNQPTASTLKQLGQTSTIGTKKYVRPTSKSPEEVRRPPSKRQNKNNTMATPSTTKKDKDNTSDLAELEKRLLAGFASMIQREIEPLKMILKR